MGAGTGPARADRPVFAECLADRLADHHRKSCHGNLTPRGLPPETSETAEVGAWKIPVPEINPLDAQRLYDLGTGYREAGGLHLVFLDDLTEARRELSGEIWTLSFKARRGDVLPFLKEYARKIGAEIFSAGFDDGFVFRLTKEGSVWWCDVDAGNRDRIDLRVLRQRVLALNEELRVTKNMSGRDGSFRFLADVPGRRFLLLRCRLASGTIRLRANNDATVKGVKLVRGKTRPAVVVFTDGVDSREDRRGTGSTNTREQAVKKILDARVPVNTIGFGKRLNADQSLTNVDGAPDIGCLTEFAAISNGQYYPAKDPEALRAVFAAIGSRLGNNFVITYRRPTENRAGTAPVVSLVIDNTGSINTDPKKPGAQNGDLRMEKTKRLLRDFVGQLPETAVMQFSTFQGGGAKRVEMNRRQVSTTTKVLLLKAIGEMIADDGTPIVAALTSALENLVSIPSQKKVIVFHTDNGLEVPPDRMPEFQKILSRIRDQGIFVLWIGMGISTPEKEKVFAEAAKATDGEYVISESADEIAGKLSTLLGRLQQPVVAKLVPLTIAISYRSPQGETLTYKAQDQAGFTPSQKVGTPLEPDVVIVRTGEKAPLNDLSTARTVGGTALEGVDNVVRARSEIGRSMSNQAMEMALARAVYLDRLMGLEARKHGFQFVALELELKNRAGQNIPYEIPGIFKHFYLGLDGKGLYPASKATWLVEKPVARPGDPAIRIPPGGIVAGTLVFLVPSCNDGFRQLSLHFYDTKYGHIQMPIAGEMPPHWLYLEKLPTVRPTAPSDAFSFEVTAAGLESSIDRYAAGDHALFRVIEAEFRSRVQGLLNIDPARPTTVRPSCPCMPGTSLPATVPPGFRPGMWVTPSVAVAGRKPRKCGCCTRNCASIS